MSRLACGAFACVVWVWSALASAQELEVHFIDVGQGDAALIRCPDGGGFALIDAGDTRYPGSAEAFRGYMDGIFGTAPEGRALSVVVASHPHTDHIGSMRWVLESFDVDVYVDNGERYDTALWRSLEKVRRRQARLGQIEYLNGRQDAAAVLRPCASADVEMTVLSPWAKRALSGTNDRSVLIHLRYQRATFLFVGDLETHGEEVALARFGPELLQLLDVDVLKVGHHGSDTSSSAGFLQAITPRLAIVSAGHANTGTNGGYKHPRIATLRRFTRIFRDLGEGAHPGPDRVPAFNGQVWQRHERVDGLWVTAVDGTVIVRSDGSAISARSADVPQVVAGGRAPSP
jgi:beta-lactamase superfamily II metal-dependent hydrolase